MASVVVDHPSTHTSHLADMIVLETEAGVVIPVVPGVVQDVGQQKPWAEGQQRLPPGMEGVFVERVGDSSSSLV